MFFSDQVVTLSHEGHSLLLLLTSFICLRIKLLRKLSHITNVNKGCYRYWEVRLMISLSIWPLLHPPDFYPIKQTGIWPRDWGRIGQAFKFCLNATFGTFLIHCLLIRWQKLFTLELPPGITVYSNTCPYNILGNVRDIILQMLIEDVDFLGPIGMDTV